ncbi:MAG: zinc metallopeptidase [Firmicutes bacterium]|nr:zinc metallopeptidase [Bacillota bacterium]MBQ5798142.1 zinc metallopeptidase [Bacillota bacterium]
MYGYGGYGGYGYYSSMIFLIPAILFTLYAQSKVNSAYARFARVANRRGMTGAQAARMILDANGMSDVPIQVVAGKLSDHYDPRHRVMRLSQQVYHEPSIASVAIAAHEAGHAIQHSVGYSPLKIRNTIVPVVNLCSNMAWPILMVGLLMGHSVMGDMVFNLGVLLFSSALVFQLITLPVEFNASNRALEQMEAMGIVTNDQETRGAKKVLSAAALTYVAALAMAVANLIRILSMRGRRD